MIHISNLFDTPYLLTYTLNKEIDTNKLEVSTHEIVTGTVLHRVAVVAFLFE